MGADEQLTILLTLKDRSEFTARWMSYAEHVRLPFRVLIADGGSDNAVEVLLADRARFPNVDYEYLRFPEDTTYQQYYAKIDDALGLVRTPFVCMADNDDFLVPGALAESVRFLAANPEYSACGGQEAVFWVLSDASAEDGDLLYSTRVDWKCTSLNRSGDAPTAVERLLNWPSSNADPLYYDVKRSGEARRQFQIVRQLNLADLFLVEYLVHYLTVVAGKTKRLEQLHLARQRNSPGSSGGEHQKKFGDWMGRMLVESWSVDFAKFLATASGALATADRISADEARDYVVEAYRKHVAPSLLSDLLQESTITLPMLTALPAVRRLVSLPEGNILKRVLRRIYRRLNWISLDAVLGTEIFTRPSASTEPDLRPIRAFLASRQLAKDYGARNPTSGT